MMVGVWTLTCDDTADYALPSQQLKERRTDEEREALVAEGPRALPLSPLLLHPC